MKFKQLIIFVSILFFTSSCTAQVHSKKSIKEAIITFAYNDIDKAIVHYKNLKKNNEEDYNFDDKNELNSLGYQLINDNRVNDAIKVFQFLVSEFPNGYNGYDSLGEAYYIKGDYEKAIVNYQKSLDLNPENTNAERIIAEIKFKNREKDKFYKTYSKQQYLDDLDELAKTLTTINPHPYKSISKNRFWKVVEDKKGLITDNTTYADFIWHCSELVANINCGHSAIPMYFQQESEMLLDTLRFPMELFYIDGRLYVADALTNNHSIRAGTEVFSINGKSSIEITEDIFKHISTQGKVESASKRHFFNAFSSAIIPYALGFPKNYTVVVAGQKQPIALKRLDEYKSGLKNLSTCKETFCLDFINKNTALLTINHWDFYGNRFSILQKFIDNSFKEIFKKNPHNLIIDVRGNGGGNSWGASHLLQYLIKKPFTYFKVAPHNDRKLKPLDPFETIYKGNIYFLADGRSGSTTGQLLALAKHHNIGTIIGEESNGSIFYTGGQRMFYLKNTSVFYLVSSATHINDIDSMSEERGVFPHHYSIQTIEDYLNGIDTTLEYTLELVEKE
ncbi:S41 family peptidase [Psychroserpens sp. MEBiC05023]